LISALATVAVDLDVGLDDGAADEAADDVQEEFEFANGTGIRDGFEFANCAVVAVRNFFLVTYGFSIETR